MTNLDTTFSQWIEGMNSFFVEAESCLSKNPDALHVDDLSYYVSKFAERADELDRIHATHGKLFSQFREKESRVRRGRGFDHLPPEIVGQIFILASEPGNPSTATIDTTATEASLDTMQRNPEAALILSQVSQKWREIALDTAALWSSVVYSKPELLRLVLKRSKVSLIDVRIVVPTMWVNDERDDDDDYDYHVVEKPNRPAMRSRTRTIMELLIPHIGRWRQFSYEAISTPLVELALKMCEGLSAPNLEKLSLASAEPSARRHSFPFPFRYGSTPKLRSIAFLPEEVQLKDHHDLVSWIQYLDLEVHNEAWDVLRLLGPTLKQATLRIVRRVSEFPPQPIELCSLTSLTIQLATRAWDKLYLLIDSFSSDTLASLTLRTDIDPYVGPKWLEPDFPSDKPHFPNLTHLICDVSPSFIHNPLKTQGDAVAEYCKFEAFFWRFETIKKLTIRNASALNNFIKQLQQVPEPGDGDDLLPHRLEKLEELEIVNCTGGGVTFLLEFVRSRGKGSYYEPITKVRLERTSLREIELLRESLERKLKVFSYTDIT